MQYCFLWKRVFSQFDKNRWILWNRSVLTCLHTLLEIKKKGGSEAPCLYVTWHRLYQMTSSFLFVSDQRDTSGFPSLLCHRRFQLWRTSKTSAQALAESVGEGGFSSCYFFLLWTLDLGLLVRRSWSKDVSEGGWTPMKKAPHRAFFIGWCLFALNT